jgi:hypothetical protein
MPASEGGIGSLPLQDIANLDLGRNAQRVVALVPAGLPETRQSGNHVTVTLNFSDEERRRVAR